MLPTYLQQELLLRLSPERTLVMAKSVGLDPASQPPALDRQIGDRLEFNGSIEFVATICCQDDALSVPCQLTFSVDLIDGEDAEAGELVRVVGEAHQSLHALIPTGEKQPVFEWVSIPHRLLPFAAIAKLDDKVEELARIMELSRPGQSDA